MFTKSLLKLSLIPAAALILMTTDASAGSRQRNFLFQTGNGTTGQVSGTVNRSAGHATGSFTGSTSNGGGWTRNFDRSYDPATKSWNQTGQVTTNSGKTYNYSGSGSCTPGAGCSSSGGVTGPNGKTVTHNGTVQATGNGGWQTNGTWTGPNGQTATRSGTGQYEGNGIFDSNAQWTGPNGNTVNTQHWIQITPAQ